MIHHIERGGGAGDRNRLMRERKRERGVGTKREEREEREDRRKRAVQVVRGEERFISFCCMREKRKGKRWERERGYLYDIEAYGPRRVLGSEGIVDRIDCKGKPKFEILHEIASNLDPECR